MKRFCVCLVAVVGCGGPDVNQVVPPSTAPQGVVVLASAPPDALVLEVRAIRWSCDVTHPGGVVTPDLQVPAGRPIKLVVSTPEWPAQARGLEVSIVGTNVAMPVVKDAPVVIAFRIAKPGTYQWRCPTLVPPEAASPEAIAQRDPLKPLTALTPAAYDAMLAASAEAKPVELGAKLYQRKGCVGCHTIDGSPRIGPSWKGIWGTSVQLADGSTRTVDAGYVTDSVLHPQAFARPGYPPVMPSFEGQLRERELAAIVAFIESLK